MSLYSAASAFGPRRITSDECARVLRESGPKARVPLLAVVGIGVVFAFLGTRWWPLSVLGLGMVLTVTWAGGEPISWFARFGTAFTANVATNVWLGFPFMMVVALGALESIPRELYEAASVDGASAWQRFRHITLPHLRPALGPAVALGSIWTFNMFNVIFLVSAGKPGGSTNILVTDAYRWAFERGERYGMAAAYATIIFLVLLLWTVFGTRIVRSKDGDA